MAEEGGQRAEESEARAKEAAAQRAAEWIDDGMVVGLGTGSTAAPFVRALGERVRAGLRVTGVPTSEATTQLARSEGIPLTTLEDQPALDIDVDGADAVDPDLNLLKGLGGALLREKIIASASRRFVVVIHTAKLVQSLDQAGPVPVEVIPFGWSHTQHSIEALGATATRRTARDARGDPYLTDGGHYILDCHFDDLSNLGRVASQLKALTGVVEHGLFLRMATDVIVGDPSGATRVLQS